MPYAPGIQYSGDRYLFQGISQAGDNFAEAIRRKKDEAKQREELLGLLDAMHTDTPTASFGISPEEAAPGPEAFGGSVQQPGGSDALGALIGEKTKAQKEAEQADKRQGKMADALQLLASEAGMPPGAAKTKSNEYLRGYLLGQDRKRRIMEEQQQMQARQAEMTYQGKLGSQIDANMLIRQQAEANRQKFPALARELGRFQPAADIPYIASPEYLGQYGLPAGQVQPGPRELMRAYQASGYVPPDTAQDDLIRTFAGGGEAARNRAPEKTTLGGTDVIFNRFTGQFQLVPKTFDEASTPDVEGYTPVPDGKGGVRYLRNRGEVTGDLKEAKDASGNPIPGVFVDPYSGKTLDLRSEIQKLRGNPTAPAAAPPAARPAPKSPAPTTPPAATAPATAPSAQAKKGSKEAPFESMEAAAAAGIQPGQYFWIKQNGKVTYGKMVPQ
jgi:hypothetical protein